jgi:hypothetical protein
MIIENNDGSISFLVFRPGAQGIELRGDFTRWHENPIPLRRAADGWWTVSLRLEPGDYLFNYLVDGREWLPDYAAHGIRPSGYGGWVSQLCVTASIPTPPPARTHRPRRAAAAAPRVHRVRSAA